MISEEPKSKGSSGQRRRHAGTTWADLFLALLYAASILLFLAWLGDLTLKDPPSALQGIMNSGWSWAVSAASGAIIGLVFKSRIQLSVFVWSCLLVFGLGAAAYYLRQPHPLPPEHWQTTEGQFHGNWHVNFDGTPFDCFPIAGSQGSKCRALAWGSQRAVERFDTREDNPCTFFGTLNGTVLSSSYNCRNGGPYTWSAVILPRSAGR